MKRAIKRQKRNLNEEWGRGIVDNFRENVGKETTLSVHKGQE